MQPHGRPHPHFAAQRSAWPRIRCICGRRSIYLQSASHCLALARYAALLLASSPINPEARAPTTRQGKATQGTAVRACYLSERRSSQVRGRVIQPLCGDLNTSTHK